MKWYDISFVYNEYNSKKFSEITTNMKCTGWYQYPEEGNLRRSFQICASDEDLTVLRLSLPDIIINSKKIYV